MNVLASEFIETAFHHSYSVEQQNEFTLDVDLNLPAVGITVVFGESGSGKSTVGNAVINLLDEPGKISNGSIILDGINIHEKPESIVKFRGKNDGRLQRPRLHRWSFQVQKSS